MNNQQELIGPSESGGIFLAHCAISPLYRGAARAMKQYVDRMALGGISALPDYFDVMPRFHKLGGQLLKTSSSNISYIHNTAEAMCQIANGYPFEPGDQVISYVHEYPSNHYPWVLQQKRGVELRLLGDEDPIGCFEDCSKPRGWLMKELYSLVTERTRVVAISHVQFSSGFATDLDELGLFCKERGIDLIVDCAQSLGCLPVYPEKQYLSAVASSSWKWLLGPKGSGILYTSPELRDKLRITMAGPGLMVQGLDYLDHSWNPHEDGRRFEYSTLPWDHVAGLNTIFEDLFVGRSMEKLFAEVVRLHDILLDNLDPNCISPLVFHRKNRSGILTARVNGDMQQIISQLAQEGVTATAPVGYLRLAPHFYQNEEEMVRAAEIINRVCFQGIRK